MTIKELKEYNDLVSEYNELYKENQELKKQLKYHIPDENIAYFKGKNESKMKINRLRSDIKELKEEKEEWINLLDMFKNKQKEFIEYMTKTIEELECDDVDDEEIKCYLIQRTYTFKEILSKYKEIIGNIFDEKE